MESTATAVFKHRFTTITDVDERRLRAEGSRGICAASAEEVPLVRTTPASVNTPSSAADWKPQLSHAW
jgi:hypothetical protein